VDEMGRACDTHGDQKHVQGFDGNLKEDDHFEDFCVCERMTLKYI
jgi:hypothetical protein